MGHGATNREIAARLDLSAKTVADNVSDILTKLGVGDRARAGALAVGQD